MPVFKEFYDACNHEDTAAVVKFVKHSPQYFVDKTFDNAVITSCALDL
jgi:hypothetical protein